MPTKRKTETKPKPTKRTRKAKPEADELPLERDESLTAQQQLFADLYFAGGMRNATKHAVTAGYSEKTAAQQASRLLKNVKVKAYLDKRYSEQVMSRDETLFRISAHGQADIIDFAGLSLDELKNHPRSFVIKKLKRTVDYDGYAPGGIFSEQIELEVHDPKDSLKTIAGHHNLFRADGLVIDFDLALVVECVNALRASGADPDTTFRQLMEVANASVRARIGAGSV